MIRAAFFCQKPFVRAQKAENQPENASKTP